MEENALELVEKLQQRELTILIAAKKKAQDDAISKPTAQNLEALDKATKMLAEYLNPQEKDEPSFENRLEVLKHLKRLGYKIGKSKLYQDVKARKLRIQSDGSVLESDIKNYVSTAGLVKPDQLQYEFESSKLTRKKQKSEVQKLAAQVEKLDFENRILRKEYVRRDQVETEQAIKAGALMAGLNHTFRTFSRDAIQLVNGELKHNQALISFWITKTEDLFDEFARMDEIQVKFKN